MSMSSADPDRPRWPRTEPNKKKYPIFSTACPRSCVAPLFFLFCKAPAVFSFNQQHRPGCGRRRGVGGLTTRVQGGERLSRRCSAVQQGQNTARKKCRRRAHQQQRGLGRERFLGTLPGTRKRLPTPTAARVGRGQMEGARRCTTPRSGLRGRARRRRSRVSI